MDKPKKLYRVLVPIANDKTGKRYKVGDTVTTDDFSYSQIKDWQMCSPQVLQDNDVYLAGLPVEQ